VPLEPDVFRLEQSPVVLRRIGSNWRFPTFSTESVTTYAPVVDAYVPDAHVMFDPPEARDAEPALHRTRPGRLLLVARLLSVCHYVTRPGR
jgi:hypothetical protein